MYVNSEQALDSVFLSYDKILKKLHLLGLTTKKGKVYLSSEKWTIL